MPTMEETETVPSLMASAMMCEWQSMMPGITYLPAPSINLRARRGQHLFADCGDLAVLQQNGAFHRPVGDGQDGGVLDQNRQCRRAYAAAAANRTAFRSLYQAGPH